MSDTPRETIQDALYHLGVTTDIMRLLASADISGTGRICGTYVDWLAQHQRTQQDRIEAALAKMGRV